MFGNELYPLRLLITQLDRGTIEEARATWIISVAIEKTGTKSSFMTIHEELTIRDPFDEDEHRELERHLETTLLQESRPSEEELENIKSSITQYAERLVKSLQLSHAARILSGRVLEVDVICSAAFIQRSNPAVPSLHCLYWEMVENLDAYNETFQPWTAPKVVRVRRRIVEDTTAAQGPRTRNGGMVSRENNAIENDGGCELGDIVNVPSWVQEINILVVVARRLSGGVFGDRWSPTQASSALVRVRERLHWDCHAHNIHVHVVRPGSLQELTDVLSSDRKTYHVVHFDTHGDSDTM